MLQLECITGSASAMWPQNQAIAPQIITKSKNKMVFSTRASKVLSFIVSSFMVSMLLEAIKLLNLSEYHYAVTAIACVPSVRVNFQIGTRYNLTIVVGNHQVLAMKIAHEVHLSLEGFRE